MKNNRSNKGFTLIELIMAIVIMAIIVIFVANAYNNIVYMSVKKTDWSKAVRLLEFESSYENSIDYNSVSNLTRTNYMGSGYDIQTTVTYEAGSGATTQSLKRITILVSRSGIPVITNVTFRAKNVNW